MKKDIHIPTVKDVAVAITYEESNDGVMVWNAYVVNLKQEKIEGVLVNTKGYGLLNGEQVKTSVLRHFLDEMPGKSIKKIEQVTTELLRVSNEFWLSFYLNNKMYDKKYVFLAESIKKENMVDVPVMGKKAVMIK